MADTPYDTPTANRGGRPRADEPMTAVSLWMPTRVASALDRHAKREGSSTSKAGGKFVETVLKIMGEL